LSELPLLLFLLTSLIVILTPGQDMVLVMSRSVALGPQAGVVTAAGISSGLLCHTLLAALGLGAILQTSDLVFLIMKVLGAGYLVYLGIKTFRAPPVQLNGDAQPHGSLRTLFVQGAVSNLSNPKIAIFYFAFLPQFVSTDVSSPTLTLLFLGIAFSVLTFMIKGPVGYGAGTLSGWLRSRPVVQIWMHRLSGCVLMALGVRLVLEERS